MVSSEELRKWAAEYRIHQKGESDEGHPAHQTTFRDIKYLCQINFHHYNAGASKDSYEPWKRHNVNKAAHLSRKALSLSNRSANESAWRHGIEGVIVQRLADEVACSRCNYRLWRSEIEFSRDGTATASLEHQVRNRAVCECPAEHRPVDPYEIETSLLFEDLIEGEILHDDPGRLRLTQRPDRIIGLTETENISQLLEQPPHPQVKHQVAKIRSLVQTAPFKNRYKRLSKPLLLPFLVIEAKSHKTQETFADIQTQTALPIRSFLNIQRDLWKHGPSNPMKPEPLIWFLGYKGSDWKIYACYRTESSTSEAAYTIHHLEGGDLMTREGALHLVLIFDYIADWARDSYRPSVLKQLTALATGQAFDKIVLRADKDIMSDSKAIFPRSSSSSQDTRMDGADDDSDNESTCAEEHSNVNFLHIPTSHYGVIRPMNTAVFRCTGLRITADNVRDLLPRGLGDQRNGACARELVHHILEGEHILAIAATDLGNLELMWSGTDSSSFHKYDKPTDPLFFVRLQYRCFIDLSWRIVRELTYLAISPPALSELTKLAGTQRKVPGMHSINERTLVPGAKLRDTMDCIRAGSPWQVLRSALAGTAIYLQPRIATDEAFTHRVGYFALDYVRSIRFSAFVHDLGEGFSSRHNCFTVCSVWSSLDEQAWIRNASHDDFNCRRCLASGQNVFALRDWDSVQLPSRSAEGAVLVAALKQEADPETQDRHELCLYLSEQSSASLEGKPFSTIIEQLARVGHIYHTILHRLSREYIGSDAILWNLPWPYRKSTRRQQYDIARWVHDLSSYGSTFEEKVPTAWMHIWVHQQMLLHFLLDGMAYEEADIALRAFRDDSRALYRGQQNLGYYYKDLPLSCVEISKFWLKVGRKYHEVGQNWS